MATSPPAAARHRSSIRWTPCRVVDTRGPDGNLGGPYLQGHHERDFPVLEGSCGLPSNAAAYSMNFTVGGEGPTRELSNCVARR